MDWDTYKVLADRPDYWSNWMLDQCIELMELLDCPDLLPPLRSALLETPLETPPDYKGPLRMHRLSMSPDQAGGLHTAVRRAVEEGVRTSQTQDRGLGGFIEVCRDYERLLRGGAN
ncbi:MAG: hypothetical protein AAF541_20990 [Pseudomonadota bacterium]